uniref:Ubiquitin-related modifier 1 n=1 Tax=Oryzias latipes TaxID=8090 RepID=A0A3P9KTY3_ORYLA
MAASVSVHLEFGGGAELLFDGVKEHHVTLPSQPEPWGMRQLLVWIQRNLLKERPELFVQGDSVRPGILVLINDADWELMGELDYQLQDQDNTDAAEDEVDQADMRRRCNPSWKYESFFHKLQDNPFNCSQLQNIT